MRKFLALTIIVFIGLISLSCDGNTREYGSITIYAPNAISNNEKTVSPDDNAITCAYFEVSGNHENGSDSISESFTGNSITLTKVLVGNWTFTINGFNSNGDKIVESETKSVSVASGQTATETFPVDYIKTGNGTLDFSVAVSSNMLIGRVILTVNGYDYSLYKNAQSVDGQYIYNISMEMPVGNYLGLIKVYDFSENQISNTYTEAIQIYKGIVSTATINAEISKTATPKFVPDNERITDDTLVYIVCDTPESSIYYTIDGSDPTTESTRYTNPFIISKNTVVKAIAISPITDVSSVGTMEYLLSAAKPEITAEKDINDIYHITITSKTPGAEIIYALESDKQEHTYTGAVLIDKTDTIYAYAKKEGLEDSDTVMFSCNPGDKAGLSVVQPVRYKLSVSLPEKWNSQKLISVDSLAGIEVNASVAPNTEAVFTWYLDGSELSTGKKLDLENSGLNHGFYNITVVANINGILLSDSFELIYTEEHIHIWGIGEITTEPTCVQEGVRTYTCNCGETKTEPIAMISHNAEHHERVEATCQKTGNIEYWSCDICQTNYTTKECTTDIADVSLPINPDGHLFIDHLCKYCEEADSELNALRYITKEGDLFDTPKVDFFDQTSDPDIYCIVFNLGKVRMVPVVTDKTMEYSGIDPNYSISYSQGSGYSSSLSVSTTSSYQFSEIDSNSHTFGVDGGFGKDKVWNVSLSFKAEFSHSTNRTQIDSNSKQFQESMYNDETQSYSLKLGIHPETKGYYRIAWYADCDACIFVYYDRVENQIIYSELMYYPQSNNLIVRCDDYSPDGDYHDTFAERKNLVSVDLIQNELAKYNSEIYKEDGTEKHPFRISSVDDLHKITEHNEKNTHFELYSSINFEQNGTNVSSVYNPIDEFKGILNGNGYTISNYQISNSTDKSLGFFKTIGTTGIVSNIRFLNCNVTHNTGDTFNVAETGIVCGVNKGTIEEIRVDSCTIVATTGSDTYNIPNSSVSAECGLICGSLQSGGNISCCGVYNCNLSTKSSVNWGETGIWSVVYCGGICGIGNSDCGIKDCYVDNVTTLNFATKQGWLYIWPILYHWGLSWIDAGGILGKSDGCTVSSCISGAQLVEKSVRGTDYYQDPTGRYTCLTDKTCAEVINNGIVKNCPTSSFASELPNGFDNSIWEINNDHIVLADSFWKRSLGK